MTTTRLARGLGAGLILAALLAPQAARPAGAAVTRYNVTDLGTFGGTFSYANAINARGLIAGQAYTPGDTNAYAAVWRGVAPTQLGGLAARSALQRDQCGWLDRWRGRNHGAVNLYALLSLSLPGCVVGTGALQFSWAASVVRAVWPLG